MLNFEVNKENCVKCGNCIKTCPMSIIMFDDQKFPYIDSAAEEMCMKCMHCFASCPKGAISIFGKLAKDSLELNYPKSPEMESLIKGRRSIRYFKNENIDKDLLNYALSIVLHAPTGRNSKSVAFTVLADKEKMNDFRIKAMNKLSAVAKQNKLPEKFEYYGRFVELWETKKIDCIFRNAPHMIVATAPKDCATSEKDCIIALSYLDLFAPTIGLGTLWCGLANWVINIIVPELKIDLKIPENHIIGYVMLIGKSDEKYYRTVNRETQIRYL